MAIAALALVCAVPLHSHQDGLPAPQSPGTAKVSDDWAYGCDNQYSCTVSSLGGGVEGDWDEGLRIDFLIATAPEGPPYVILSVHPSPANDMGGEETFPQTAQISAIAVNGKPLPLADVDEDFGLAPTSARWMVPYRELPRIARARVIELLDENGHVFSRTSAKGLAVAFDHIKAVRAAAPADWLHRPSGSFAQQRMVDPVRLPQFSPSLAIAMQRQANCPELDLELEEAPIAIIQNQIGAHDVFVLVSCAPAGPDGVSGPSFALPLILDQRSGEVRFAQFDIAPWSPNFTSESLIPDAYFNDDEMVLHTFAYIRDFGDCGERADYVWDSEARRFVLISKWEMPSCRSATTWLRTYERQTASLIVD